MLLSYLHSRWHVSFSLPSYAPLLICTLVTACAFQTVHAPTSKSCNVNPTNKEVVESIDLPLIVGINTNVLSDFESCDTSLHWPGGNSGPTIGRGIDLGNNSKKTIAKFFQNVVSDSVLKLLQSASGVRGEAAKTWISKHNIRITRKQADKSFYLTCRLMWNDVLKRNGKDLDDLPSEVKGIILSIAYNYGSSSRAVVNLVQAYREQGHVGMANYLEHLAEITDNKALKKRRMREREVVLLAEKPITGGESVYFD
jgi:hypothetical protein